MAKPDSLSCEPLALASKPQRYPERIERPELLREACNHFVGKRQNSAQDIKVFEELAVTLIPLVSDSDLLPLGPALAQHRDTPESVLQFLLARSSAIACNVLRYSAHLPGDYLAIQANMGSETHALAIAQRTDLDDRTINALLLRNDDAAFETLVTNPMICLNDDNAQLAVHIAKSSHILARILCKHAQFDAELLAPLFFHAEEQRRLDILFSFRRRDLGKNLRPQLTASEEARLLKIERLAREGKFEALRQTLAQALGCSQIQAERIFKDQSGETLAVSLAGLGMDWMAAGRIFIWMQPPISGNWQKIQILVKIVQTTPTYTARRLTCSMLDLPTPRHIDPSRSSESIFGGRGHYLQNSANRGDHRKSDAA